MQTQPNQTEIRTFTGWVSSYNKKSFPHWLDAITTICKRHFPYNYIQERKKESVYFRLALIAAMQIKYKQGQNTLAYVGAEVARVVKRKTPYTHCWVIHNYKLAEQAVKPNQGFHDFPENFEKFKQELEKLGLL